MKSIRLGRKSAPPTFKYVVYAAAFAGLFIAATFMLGSRAPAFRGTPQVPGDLSGESYSTHITTDKPIYRAGEKVYVRGIVLRGDGHTPVSNLRTAVTASFEIKGPRGDTAASGISPM